MWAENKAGGRSLKTYTEKVKNLKYIPICIDWKNIFPSVSIEKYIPACIVW